jgi:hypothetical protein
MRSVQTHRIAYYADIRYKWTAPSTTGSAGERLMAWDDATPLHLRARAFIEGELYPRAANERRRTIVCTHYWPSFKAVNRENPNESKWAPVCASDMDAFILEHGPRFWIAAPHIEGFPHR